MHDDLSWFMDQASHDEIASCQPMTSYDFPCGCTTMAALHVPRLGIEDLYILKIHIYWYSRFGGKDTEICQQFVLGAGALQYSIQLDRCAYLQYDLIRLPKFGIVICGLELSSLLPSLQRL